MDYKFNAKELDNETGMYYYGARYYTPELSVWLSVDPLSDKAPGWSPYRYGFNNPVRFTDPNGLFESESDAKQWAKDNGIKTGFLRNHKIRQDADGSWAINNRREGVSHFRDNSGVEGYMAGRGEDGVVAASTAFESHTFENKKKGFKAAWNTRAIGKEIPDNISIDLTLSSAFVGGGSMTYSINLLTRGSEPGFHLTRTEQQRAGGEIDWGLNLNIGHYLGNPLDINKSTLLGPVKSVSGGWGIGGNGYFGYYSKSGKELWLGVGGGIGLTYGASYGWGKTYPSWNK